MSVIHSVHRGCGGVPDQVHPPGAHAPWPGTPPHTRYTPLGLGTPPRTRYTPRSRPPQDQVHPTRADTPPTPQRGSPPLGPGTPPGADTQPWSTPPRTRYTPQEQTHTPRAHHPQPVTPPDQVHTHPLDQENPPGPGTLPRPGTPLGAEHAGRYGQCAGGPHSTGMQSCWYDSNSLKVTFHTCNIAALNDCFIYHFLDILIQVISYQLFKWCFPVRP